MKARILVSLMLVLGLTACGAKVPPVSPLPATMAVVDQDIKAFTGHALEIMDLSAKVALDASNIEVSLKSSVPANVQAQIDRGFLAFTAKMRTAKAGIVNGEVKTWADLKTKVDPVLAELNGLISLVKGVGPNAWQRVGRGLMTALTLLMSVTNLGAFQGA